MRNVRQFRPSLLTLLLVGAFGLISAACGQSSGTGGGSGGGKSSTGVGGLVNGNGCFDYTGFDLTTPTVTFKADILPTFRQSCGLSTSCHGTAPPSPPPLPAQHYLGPSVSDPAPTAAEIQGILAGIVGVKSIDEPDMDVITPGHPETSFMLYKLDGDPNPCNPNPITCPKLECAKTMTCLLAMPSGGTPLPDETRDQIRRWIAQGAKDD
jgi:hypothetical protein